MLHFSSLESGYNPRELAFILTTDTQQTMNIVITDIEVTAQQMVFKLLCRIKKRFSITAVAV